MMEFPPSSKNEVLTPTASQPSNSCQITCNCFTSGVAISLCAAGDASPASTDGNARTSSLPLAFSGKADNAINRQAPCSPAGVDRRVHSTARRQFRPAPHNRQPTPDRRSHPRHLAYLHGDLQDRLVLQYNLLNLALLNTMAVQLDLLILPPKECYFTIWQNARAIAAAIPYPLSERQ